VEQGGTQWKSALNTSNSAYNQFKSAWNNGTGDLTASFGQLNAFWRSLETAQTELNRLIVAPQPGPGPQPSGSRDNYIDVNIFTRLRTATTTFFDTFKECVVSPTARNRAGMLRDQVRVIGELLNNVGLSPDAVMKLTNPKRDWTGFITKYNNGLGITNASLAQLELFVNSTNIACKQILG
jgi:hypothetical protein